MREPARTGSGYAAIAQGAAQGRRAADVFAMRGPDRARFLNNLVTCDVKALAPGAGAYGFVTEPKGHVLADVEVLAEDDRFLLALPAGAGPAIAAHLGRYKIADRIEIEPIPDLVGLRVGGPFAGRALAAFGEPPGEAWRHRRLDVAGASVTAVREPDLGTLPVWTLWTPAGDTGAVESALGEAGVAHTDEAAWETARVEAGRARFGVDFGPDHFPQETGREDAVSYTKGCYLGQEVVARIHYRGGVNRHLRGLLLAGDAAVGAALSADGREAGRLTSRADSPRVGRAIGLAVLHRRAADPGTRLEVEGGGTAEVVELPFA